MTHDSFEQIQSIEKLYVQYARNAQHYSEDVKRARFEQGFFETDMGGADQRK